MNFSSKTSKVLLKFNKKNANKQPKPFLFDFKKFLVYLKGIGEVPEWSKGAAC
jgi:hypothetical protein